MLVHKILENVHIHNFVQKTLSIGRSKAITFTENFISENCHGKVLDIGCGAARHSHLFGDNYTGIDINLKYLKTQGQKGKEFVCADATSFPFKRSSFDAIFSVGFFHHVDSISTTKVFKEIVHVSKPDATILIIDAFYPDYRLDILGYMLGKLDRGNYFRRKETFINEAQGYFNIIDSKHIDHSYPYNLWAFILQACSQ